MPQVTSLYELNGPSSKLDPFLCLTGTYNNQYMILDLKRVELKKSLLSGALWVVEQIPG